MSWADWILGAVYVAAWAISSAYAATRRRRREAQNRPVARDDS